MKGIPGDCTHTEEQEWEIKPELQTKWSIMTTVLLKVSLFIVAIIEGIFIYQYLLLAWK